MSEESVTPPSITNESFYQEVSYFSGMYSLNLKGICL